jgi:Uncharacterised protein family (UPF0158)
MPKVKLSELMDVFEVPAEWCFFVSKIDGRIVQAGSEEMEAAYEPEEDDEALEDWQRDMVKQLREVHESDDWIDASELRDELHEYGLLTEFARSQKDERTRERLLDALDGKGAFRRAKNILEATGLREQWFAYRGEAAKSLALEWLEANGFEAGD